MLPCYYGSNTLNLRATWRQLLWATRRLVSEAAQQCLSQIRAQSVNRDPVCVCKMCLFLSFFSPQDDTDRVWPSGVQRAAALPGLRLAEDKARGQPADPPRPCMSHKLPLFALRSCRASPHSHSLPLSSVSSRCQRSLWWRVWWTASPRSLWTRGWRLWTSSWSELRTTQFCLLTHILMPSWLPR